MEQTGASRRGRRSPRVGVAESLEQKIARISELDAAALQESWKLAFGVAPPPNLGRTLMIRALAYRIQEGALGGLKPSTLRIFDRVSEGRTSVESGHTPKRRASAGTVLIREWRGVSHRVTVLDNDVVYQGRRYKSLSEVARVITGTRWSGPMFFGLSDRSKGKAHG